MLAAIRNTYGGSVSALTTSESDLLASIASAAGGSASDLTQDEERMLATLLAALGGSGSALTSSTDALLAASVNAADSGGAPVPLATLDFLAGSYTVGGTSYALTDVMNGATAVTANGLEVLTANSTRPNFIGALKALIDANSFTLVVELIKFDGDSNRQVFWAQLTDFSHAIDLFMSEHNFDGGAIFQGDDFNAPDIVHSETLLYAEKACIRVAYVVTPDRYAIKAYGSSGVGSFPMTGYGATTWDTVQLGHSDGANNSELNGYIRRVWIYEALADGDLPDLVAPPSGSPANTVAPVITGTAQVGETLTCDTGAWTGSGISYAYQWFSSDANDGTSVAPPIDGETASTYVVGEDKVARYIGCFVYATNATWVSAAKTAWTDLVVAADWLPSGAVVYSDFVNGRYYAGGAPTTLEDVWIENVDWSVWDASLVVDGVGLVSDPNNSAPTLNRTYSTPILAGTDFYVRSTGVLASSTSMEIAASELPGYTRHREVDPLPGGHYTVDDFHGTSDGSDDHTALTYLSTVVAFTANTVRVSMNGDDPTSHSVSTAGDPLTDIEFGLLGALGSGATITDITIWTGVPSDATMKALSQPTRTAPHDLTLNDESVLGPLGPGTVAAGSISLTIADNFSVVDDEGDAITWSLSDDGGGTWGITDGVLSNLVDLEPGDYFLTLRATAVDGFTEITFAFSVDA
ncbi:hypothetical protein [Bradyrhizobium sp. 150]|uniref:hypothetical protein n=1 Tax=Bradyrhizobium sp. 150 TaxID=2782625 RepID=UPI001FF76724|nr:hypothetical protein [Bradyrhizobium sp. 150]MCK1670290.1 hypothetical protein [Bradyrhizobium sp. 150]